MTDRLMEHPAVQGAKQQLDETVSEGRKAARTHNTAMAKFMDHVLKAQAELYRGQLAVVENAIDQLRRAKAEPTVVARSATPKPARRTSPIKIKGEVK